jgi:membrane-bound ClpP family serine protease
MLLANPPATRVRRTMASLLAVTGLCMFVPSAAWGQTATDGLFFSVPNPITDAFVKQVQQKVNEADKNGSGRKISVVVFDFNPGGSPSATSVYSSCYGLADYILTLRDKFKTIAFVSNKVTQHTVLPVLACQQLVMSDVRDEKTKLIKAEIGDVTRRGQEHLKPEILEYYRKLAEKDGLGDLVERMINKDLPLKKIKKGNAEGGGTFYLSRDSIKKLPANSFTEEKLTDNETLELGRCLFDARLVQELSWPNSSICETREALARKLDLPRKVLTEDYLMGRTPVVWRIDVKGETDKASMDSLERRIKYARGRGANFIIFQLEGSGGDTTHVASTAEFISTLIYDNDSAPIKTVAYIPPGTSLGAATFLALGCSEIVMADTAVLADFSYLSTQKDAELKVRRDMLVPFAKKQGYPWKLFDASLNPNLTLYWAQPKNSAKGTREQLMTQEELDDDAKGKNEWEKIPGTVTNGQLLKINANLAQLSHTAQVLNGASLDNLYALYGLDPARINVSRDGWLDRVAEFFREPVVGFVLVMLGIIGLILELKMPGTAVPGVLAAICFVLFFWSYSFVGEFTMLAVLLFVLGVILLGVEIFVLPGFGFTGIAGIILIVCSLALVTLEKWPSSPDEWYSLGTTLGTFGMSLVAAVVAAMVVAWFLPSIPYVNRLVLAPPVEEAEPFESAPQVSLLGAIGLASTSLRPAGKAQFGDEFHDVIAEGDFVNPGKRVQVIEIEGNRIVVKEI